MRVGTTQIQVISFRGSGWPSARCRVACHTLLRVFADSAVRADCSDPVPAIAREWKHCDYGYCGARRRRSWGLLVRRTGIVGLITVAMLFAPTVAIQTLGEPPFTATAEQARAFFTNGSVGWPQLVTVVPMLAAIGLIWFLVGLALLLARAEGKPPWRSGVALVSGVMLAAYLLLDVSWDAASYGAADLDLAVASFAFDLGNLGFANIWLAMGSFAISCGWIVLSTRALGRWLGWWSIVAGAGLILVRFAWSGEIWFVPYALFWLWVIIVCIQLIHRKIALPEAAEAA
jgi:hypothetical protein